MPVIQRYEGSISTVIAEFSVTTVQYFMTRKHLSIKTILMSSYKYIISALFMFAVSMSIPYALHRNDLVCIIIQICASSIVYFAILSILKDDMFEYIIKTIKHERV